MANSLTTYYTFVPATVIRSASVNANFATIKDGSPFWQKYTVGFASFQALGLTVTGSVVLTSLGAGEVVNARMVKHSEAVTGTSITAAICRVGKSGTDDYYTDDFNVFQAVSGSAAQKTQGMDCEFSTTSLILTLSLTGGKLSQLSTGSFDVYVLKNTIP